MLSKKISILLMLLFFFRYAHFLNIRMTNVRCTVFNKSWAIVNLCRLKAIDRTRVNFDMNITILNPAYQIDLNTVMYQKALGGYKPFVINYTIDACQFMYKRNNPIASWVYKFYADFSNINHTCPYVGDQILDGFYLRPELVSLPLPNGDYLLSMNWILHKNRTFETNVYLTCQGFDIYQ